MARNSEDLIAGLVADLKPVAPLRQAAGMRLALLALSGGVIGMIAIFGPRADLMAGQPDGLALLGAGLFLVLALASAWAAVDMARPYVGMRREGWGWTALMAAMLPVGGAYTMGAAWWRGLPSGFEMNGSDCMRFGLGWGVLMFGALVVWLRRGAPSLPRRAGLLTGVASGAAGIFAVSLYCPHNDLIHIGVWHGLTVVVAGLIGRLAVPRLIAW
ncbi:MAG: DUF1109 domain-containing protein [Novosphingobium sp.]|uniref:NrsF family protein n=1 Tax=Novosphingobium sp. TaxID=1874826 RepID=UPI003C7A2985